uniref:Uncharacterized protein n=1 Tax=Oryza rufipogon TaxID=4529 RepID=A0A0E0MWT8_ORYRU
MRSPRSHPLMPSQGAAGPSGSRGRDRALPPVLGRSLPAPSLAPPPKRRTLKLPASRPI